jgi:hypothetical protein
MAEALELARPFVRSGARFHPDQARWQACDDPHEFIAPAYLAKFNLSRSIHPMQRKHSLCQINSQSSNLFHGFPSLLD